ncbi:MAG: hypothetical protein HY436_01205 [Candidatus Liptonbacteria bacterium]|nr:hypothetical protein [Candidatus Liptonbacteria bacterium]
MKKGCAVLLFVGLVLSLAAEGATSADVARVVSCMKSRHCKHTIEAKSYGTLGEQIVFVEGGKRYTFYWSGADRPVGFLSVWVRPEGEAAGGEALLTTFVDRGLDGSVDFGHRIPTLGEVADLERKSFRSENDPDAPATGLEFRGYWQRQFEEAVAAAIRRLF